MQKRKRSQGDSHDAVQVYCIRWSSFEKFKLRYGYDVHKRVFRNNISDTLSHAQVSVVCSIHVHSATSISLGLVYGAASGGVDVGWSDCDLMNAGSQARCLVYAIVL